MIDTILLDLDGTLLKFSQDAFINAYLAELKKVFAKLGMDTESSLKAVMTGTKAMLVNDGSMLNSQRFWEKFAGCLEFTEERCKAIEAACDNFYLNEFNAVKSVMEPNDISKRLVRMLATKGYSVVLATNPLFPACAVTTRLDWIGLTPQDFQFITHYENSTYCKPRPEYYQEIFAGISKEPAQCFMAGNSPTEDMCVGSLGAETFLVTDCMENAASVDIDAYRHGTLAELETYLMSLPDIKA
jgi:FMN phosphatase YigB (HAD superfamily)